MFILLSSGKLLQGPNKSIIEEHFNGVRGSDKTPQMASQGKVVFHINGTETTVHNPDPNMSLNEWIRGQPGLKGWCQLMVSSNYNAPL